MATYTFGLPIGGEVRREHGLRPSTPSCMRADGMEASYVYALGSGRAEVPFGLAYGWTVHDADPARSLAALRRGLLIARDSGNRAEQSHIAAILGTFATEHGDQLGAFDYFAVAIGNYHDSGNSNLVHGLLGILAAFFDRLGRYEPAATIAGFAVTSPFAAQPVGAEFGTAIAHLRDVLGDQPTNRSPARVRR